MRKMHQTEWFGLRFSETGWILSEELADARFYDRFYRYLFTKFSAWSDLPSAWRYEKQPVVDLLHRSMHTGGKTLLSVGCGIGFVEHELLQRGVPPENLFLNEIAEIPLSWIRKEVAHEHIYVGHIPECLPPQKKWDIVYLGNMDYALGQKDLVSLLKALRARLQPDGKCILVTTAIVPSQSIRQVITNIIKDCGKGILGFLGIRERGQFWGWNRTPDELEDVFRAAGYSRFTPMPMSLLQPNYCFEAGGS